MSRCEPKACICYIESRNHGFAFHITPRISINGSVYLIAVFCSIQYYQRNTLLVIFKEALLFLLHLFSLNLNQLLCTLSEAFSQFVKGNLLARDGKIIEIFHRKPAMCSAIITFICHHDTDDLFVCAKHLHPHRLITCLCTIFIDYSKIPTFQAAKEVVYIRIQITLNRILGFFIS